MRTDSNRASGFTLVEVLLAVGIAAVVMGSVTVAFVGTLRTQYEIENLSSSTEVGQRVLALIERDLRGMWHHNIKDNKVLVGRDLAPGGVDADRLDFLTTTDSIAGTIDTSNNVVYPGVCEVGYWLKENLSSPGLLELWRREDPLVDHDLLAGGRFQLVTDRIKSFNIEYFETLGYEAEAMFEWDSGAVDMLPRRIKIQFTIERKIGNANEVSGAEIEDFEKTLKTYTRHIVLDRRFTGILQPGVAMVPVAPGPPGERAEAGGPVGGGGGGPVGGGGPAGGGGAGPVAGEVDMRGAGRGTSGDAGGKSSSGSGRGASPPPNTNFDLGNLLRGFGGGGGGR